MRKIGILIIFVVLLQACSEVNTFEKEREEKPIVDDNSVKTELPSTKTIKEIPSISIAPSTFHSVIGWLSNDEIAFVLVEKGEWTIQSYTISSKSWKAIYTSKIPVIQASIHPDKELILLHTSNNSSSAEVQVIHKDGYLVQSLSFESAELYMDWHPTNPNLIVFSTFYEDWSYNTFVYDHTTQNLASIEVNNPFVKWYDEDHLMFLQGSESSLDGAELMVYSITDQSVKETGMKHLVDVQNLGESMLYININEQKKQYEYHLENVKSKKTIEWTSPAISNYSEWVIPTISVLNPNQLILMKATKSGNIDEADKTGIISSVSTEGERELGEIVTQPIVCAPSGEVCLAGYESDKWIQLSPFIEQQWIHLKE